MFEFGSCPATRPARGPIDPATVTDHLLTGACDGGDLRTASTPVSVPLPTPMLGGGLLLVLWGGTHIARNRIRRPIG